MTATAPTAEPIPIDLSGAVVVITGAGGGIGSATATAFAALGAKVVLVDVDRSALHAVRASLGESGVADESMLEVVADAGDETAVGHYFDEVLQRFGRIDVLVNNAGVEGDVAPAHEYTSDVFDRIMHVNVRSVWLNSKYAVLAMRRLATCGRIINIGSAVSLVGAAGLAPYTASKHAVLGLTRSVALEVAKYGIRVNAVCPGPTDTRMQRAIECGLDADPDQAHRDVVRLIPLGRYALPQEIAQVVVFLACGASSFMTGAAVAVDGAMTTG